MSNIIPITENQSIHTHDNARKKATESFQESLDKALETRGASQPSAPPPPLGEIHLTAALHRIDTPSEEIATRTNQLLDLLENYAGDLNNPLKSPKEIEPIIDKIDSDANDLLQKTKMLNPPDDSLRDIASEVALTARVERIKFQRGDYV